MSSEARTKPIAVGRWHTCCLPLSSDRRTGEPPVLENDVYKQRIIAAAMSIAAVAAFALPAEAQRRTTFGFAAGATIPIGVLGDATSTGFHALGTLSISGTATSPIGFRVDGMYNNLSGKSSGPDLTVWTVNGNLVYAFPGGLTATPYLIGGAGWYNMQPDESDVDSTNDFGLNGGVGARFALSGLSTFAEIRFHNIFSENESGRLLPLTFGIVF